MQLKWTIVALQTGTRSDGADVVIRWRKHQSVGRMTSTHAVDVRTADGHCSIYDQRGMTECQAEYQYECRRREVSGRGYRITETTHAAVGVH